MKSSILFHFADSLVSSSGGCGGEIDLTERVCSEHISDQVNLKWSLAGTETIGITSLKGITLSSAMLGLITVAPLQWGINAIFFLILKTLQMFLLYFLFALEIFVDSISIRQQTEITCAAGQSITIGIKISNLSPSSLHQLTVTMQFYQDYQNGIQNFKLETRVIISGPEQ